MIRNVLESIQGVGIYPVVSLILFTTFFAGMLIAVFRLKKSTIQYASRLPLDDHPTPPNRSGDHHV
jgi:cbb3-type cytochrome oxidase subunit 3